MFENKLHFSEEKHKLELQAQKEAKKKRRYTIHQRIRRLHPRTYHSSIAIIYPKNKIAKGLAIQKEIAAKLENENLLHKIELIEKRARRTGDYNGEKRRTSRRGQ